MQLQLILASLALVAFSSAQSTVTACTATSTTTVYRRRTTITETSTTTSTSVSTQTITPSTCPARGGRRTTTFTVTETPSPSVLTITPTPSTTTITQVSVTTDFTTISPTPSICPYSGPFIDLLTYASTDCSTAPAPDGFAPAFTDYQITIDPTTRRSRCVQFTSAVGSFSFITDGTAAESSCTLQFYNTDFCQANSAIGVNVELQANRCWVPAVSLGQGSAQVFC